MLAETLLAKQSHMVTHLSQRCVYLSSEYPKYMLFFCKKCVSSGVASYTGGEGTWKQVGTCQEHCKDWTILPDMFPAGTFHTHSECNATMHLEYSHQEHLIHIWNIILTCSRHSPSGNIAGTWPHHHVICRYMVTNRCTCNVP